MFFPLFFKVEVIRCILGSYISYASKVWGGAVSGDINSLLINLKDVQDRFLMLVFLSRIYRYLRNQNGLQLVLIFGTADV